MTNLTRRAFALSLPALALAGCQQRRPIENFAHIDGRADTMLRYMYDRYPGTRDVAEKASGMLVMPLMTEAGIGIGAAYGEGVLRVNNRSEAYYSAAKASAGLQIGAQQYSHVLFFMTPGALADFRGGAGWAAGANIHYAIKDEGGTLAADTLTTTQPLIAVIFAQAGLRIGASLEGVKYTRIAAR